MHILVGGGLIMYNNAPSDRLAEIMNSTSKLLTGFRAIGNTSYKTIRITKQLNLKQ